MTAADTPLFTPPPDEPGDDTPTPNRLSFATVLSVIERALPALAGASQEYAKLTVVRLADAAGAEQITAAQLMGAANLATAIHSAVAASEHVANVLRNNEGAENYPAGAEMYGVTLSTAVEALTVALATLLGDDILTEQEAVNSVGELAEGIREQYEQADRMIAAQRAQALAQRGSKLVGPDGTLLERGN
jgi:hypothetical protein